MFKTVFLQKMSITSKHYLTTDFSLTSANNSELSTFIPVSLKSIVTVELTAQNAGQLKFDLKTHANKFIL